MKSQKAAPINVAKLAYARLFIILMKCLRSQGFELGQGTPCPYIFSRLIAFFCVSRLFDEPRSQLFE